MRVSGVREQLSICIVTNNYTPYSGGVVSSIQAYANGLRGHGHTVTIVTLDFAGTHNDEPGVIRIRSPLRFVYKNNAMAIPWRASNALEGILEDLKPDIVHSQHPFLLGVTALAICKRRNIPLVFTHHTQYAAYAHYVPLPTTLTRPVINRLVEQYAREVDQVIAPSAMVRNELVSRGITTPIQVLPSPLLPIFMHSELEQRTFDHNRPLHLLTVSRFTPEKNIPFLIDMVAQLPSGSYQFTLVGYGPELESLKHRAFIHHGLSPDRVTFVVQPPKDRLAELYQSSDLFIFASQTETQGLVVAEAMAGGLPVLALRAAALDDIIVDGVNGYSLDSQESMGAAITRLCQDPELLGHLRNGAHETSARFSVESLSEQLAQLYHQTIATKNHATSVDSRPPGPENHEC